MMNRHDDRAAAECRESADDEGAPVATLHAHALSVAHAQRSQLAAQIFNFAPEGLVIHRAGGINDGGSFGPLAGGLGESLVNVHRQ